MHDYHPSLPGFDAAQLLHDGCTECEQRGKSAATALSKLDAGRFERAWTRAAEWGTRGLTNLSHAEARLLNVLWTLQVQLEQRGIPIGEIPAKEHCRT